MHAIRVFLWMVTCYELELLRYDVYTFLLIWTKQPVEAVVEPNRLLKSIYGTKQAMRCANKHLKGSLEQIGMTQLKSDEYVYFKKKGDDILILCNHVDDI